MELSRAEHVLGNGKESHGCWEGSCLPRFAWNSMKCVKVVVKHPMVHKKGRRSTGFLGGSIKILEHACLGLGKSCMKSDGFQGEGRNPMACMKREGSALCVLC